ncbi:MAG TPA: hypothetical protein VLA71_16310 [Algoriphagus sp.]|nr:hypothetical protein [Algoriphagus sp.]
MRFINGVGSADNTRHCIPGYYVTCLWHYDSTFIPSTLSAWDLSIAFQLNGGDNLGMLWLLEEEIEEVESGEWKGRDWDFPKYEEVHDILLMLSKIEDSS